MKLDLESPLNLLSGSLICHEKKQISNQFTCLPPESGVIAEQHEKQQRYRYIEWYILLFMNRMIRTTKWMRLKVMLVTPAWI